MLVPDLGFVSIEWRAMFPVSGGDGRGDLSLGFLVSTKGKKIYGGVFFFCVCVSVPNG